MQASEIVSECNWRPLKIRGPFTEREILVNQQEKPMPNDNNVIMAMVCDIVGNGGKRYAVTRLSDGASIPDITKDETITFSLSRWEGEKEPEKQQMVALEDLVKFKNGWRASLARPIQPKPS